MRKLTATEALYGFAGWLTSRDEAVTLSRHHDAAIVADLVAEFIKANDLGDVSSEDWNRYLKYPPRSKRVEARIIKLNVTRP